MLKHLKKLLKRKKLTTLVDLEKLFGIREKTSGFTQKVTEIRIDDDQDSVWLTVDIGDGASCHVGYRSCFYRSIPLGPIDNGRKIEMKFLETEKKFDPEEVYKGQPNPTKI
jgi:phosphoribosyl-AMP cyclohydrolase